MYTGGADGGAYIMKHNVTADPNVLEVFKFTKFTDNGELYFSPLFVIHNFDLIYLESTFEFMAVVQVVGDANGMYFFTIDRVNMILSSKIRMDKLAGASSHGRIAFY